MSMDTELKRTLERMGETFTPTDTRAEEVAARGRQRRRVRRGIQAVGVAVVSATLAAGLVIVSMPPPGVSVANQPTGGPVDDPDVGQEGAAESGAPSSGEFGVGVVREITSEEYGEVIVACMAEFGFVAQSVEDGEGVRYPEVSPEQYEAMEAAADECHARYPVQSATDADSR